MPLLSRLLLLPLLAPLLAVLLIASLNPRPQLSLRLLTWTSPSLPIGLWLAAAGLGGAALSAAAQALALTQGEAAEPRRRTVRRQPERPAAWSQEWDRDEDGPGPGSRPGPDRGAAPPARPPGEPAPTLSVPFRVIRRAAARPPSPPAAEAPAANASGARVSVGDGWDAALGDDW